MNTAGRIGLLGGTFDPIHVGHLSAAEAARDALSLDRVVLLPSNVPPHRPQPCASGHHRFAMTALAITSYDGLVASDFELSAAGPSYTATTLRRLHGLGISPLQLFFITGADAFAEIATWRDYPGFLADANFVVVNRGDRQASTLPNLLPQLAARMRRVDGPHAVGPAPTTEPLIFLVDRPTPPVSSTDVRTRCAAGAPLTDLVPPLVAQHIRRHELYTAGAASDSLIPGHRAPASLLHEQEHR